MFVSTFNRKRWRYDRCFVERQLGAVTKATAQAIAQTFSRKLRVVGVKLN